MAWQRLVVSLTTTRRRFLSLLLLWEMVLFVVPFSPRPNIGTRWRDEKVYGWSRRRRYLAAASAKDDPVRLSTGIRPSLHPLTINAISEALKVRAKNITAMPLRRDRCGGDDDAPTIQIALTAGRIAAEAIHQRQKASGIDGMTLEKIEEETIAGRVVGVVMRLPELERELYHKCSAVSWIAKYNDWPSFGVLLEERGSNNNDNNSNNNNNNMETSLVDQKILSDPLFTLARAECLYALFLETVEKPTLAKIGHSVPGGSVVDFLDDDRKEVLLPS